MESSILLFSPEFPCWDEETVRLAGDDPSSLAGMLESGELARRGGGYVLTPKGEAARRELAQSICVPAADMGAGLDDEAQARRALEHNRMCVFLDRAFRTQWGIKEVTHHENFPVVPCLPDDRYFAFDGERVRAIWPQHPLVESFMKAFPHWGVGARGLPAPGQAGLDAWAKENGAPAGTLTIDFMLRSRYDFNHYKGIAGMESDRFKFYNADLLYAVKCGDDPRELLPLIGKLHVFTMAQRRVYVPGWYDLDAEEQEDWTLLAFVADTETQLAELTSTLRRWGPDLIEPCRPFYILGTSIERLRAQKEPKDTLYDWFQEETVRILRPDVDDREDPFS
ncbi:hypothetical protein [Pyramidobacter piscolens]|uniref:hypothetical protein n=1 Tax=Pyramidobacter piscolens TaxID=638849 RepID=UPI001FCC197D|nr:hypothetical protein [Pyramidobacter piscolens]BDF78486.1 hypothetical protein CE91St28_12800 [Pyramidobacter piscolens]